MRRIVTDAWKEGSESVAGLQPLLDDPIASEWLAFQLLEVCELPGAVFRKCFAIIERLAAGGSENALGARMWLQESRDGHYRP